jgi:hypothetical protein
MFYAVQGPGCSGAIVTHDGVVTCASAVFEWARGEPIAPVLDFLDRQRVSWTVSDALPPNMVIDAGVPHWMH